VPFLMSQARIGVVPLQPIPKFLKNIPTKVFEYWACALPIVASNLPPIRMFFREGLYGHLVDPTDPQQWANALFHLLDNPQKAQWMGKQARTAVRARFNAAPEQRKLLRLYSTLLQEH
jgi:glycosyltransferase involved in cell wall biosynthesis